MYPPIVFFDLEGTLLKKNYSLDNGKVSPSAWTVLAKEISIDCFKEEEETKDKWNKGEYCNYTEWMRETIKIHIKYKLKKSTFTRVVNSVEIVNGAQSAIKTLRDNGVITCIISGGFKQLADRAQKDLKIDHSMSGCEYFFNEQTGYIEHYNLLPSDYNGKLNFMKTITQEYGVETNQCVFVGDGINDIEIARKAGLSIAFNAQSKLKDVCTISIDHSKGEETLIDIPSIIHNNYNE